jgi:organic radical activating enzyme
MIHQIEITTYCNFKCFYCVGRTMPQKHMNMGVFEDILNTIPPESIVNLQGEGESVLHPQFWELVDLVRKRGCHPFTITNGTLIKNTTLKPLLLNFPHIGISLDSLDDMDDTGRYHQKSLLSKIETLVKIAGNGYITVHITDYGQGLKSLIRYLEKKQIRYIAQKIQTKPDYVHSTIYSNHIHSNIPEVKKRGVVCRFVVENSMRYYTVDSLILPCSFIKGTSKYLSLENLIDTYRRGLVPECCFGCRELLIKTL